MGDGNHKYKEFQHIDCSAVVIQSPIVLLLRSLSLLANTVIRQGRKEVL